MFTFAICLGSIWQFILFIPSWAQVSSRQPRYICSGVCVCICGNLAGPSLLLTLVPTSSVSGYLSKRRPIYLPSAEPLSPRYLCCHYLTRAGSTLPAAAPTCPGCCSEAWAANHRPGLGSIDQSQAKDPPASSRPGPGYPQSPLLTSRMLKHKPDTSECPRLMGHPQSFH